MFDQAKGLQSCKTQKAHYMQCYISKHSFWAPWNALSEVFFQERTGHNIPRLNITAQGI